MNIEWRTNNAYDSVLVIDDEGKVVTWFANNSADSIRDMLVELGDVGDWEGRDPEEVTDPNEYGELVLCRAADGAVLEIGPQFAERLAFWFRGE